MRSIRIPNGKSLPLRPGAGRIHALLGLLLFANATDLQVATLALLDQGTDAYADHAPQVDALRLEIAQAYEYEHRKGKLNEETAGQWAKLNDKGGALQHTFELWKSSGRLGQTFIDEARRKASELFDEIIRLERAKAS